MAVYKPTYKDAKTGEKKEASFWWIDFTIGDKRVRESAETTRKTIALEYEKQRRHELERAMAGLPSDGHKKRISTVGELVQIYIGHYSINHRPKSVIFSKQRLAHVTRLLGSVLMPDLTETKIRDYIKTRLDEDAGGRTINMELGELSRAIGEKWSALWPKVRKLEENHDAGQALSPEQESRLLNAAAADDSPNRNPAIYSFICIAISTGMRSGEIAKLRWSNIDLDSSVVTVGKAKTRSGTGRQIPINGDLRGILESHAGWYRKKFGEIQEDWFVFPGRKGRPQREHARPLDPTTAIGDITTAWDALRKKSGVKCRFHDLRHTAATKMAEAGVSESTMLAIMGHMSRSMLERYSHIRLKAKREAVKALEMPKLGPRLVPAKIEQELETLPYVKGASK